MSAMARTPLKRRRTGKPRRTGTAKCAYSDRCKTFPRVIVTESERLCLRHATWTADKLVGDYVKARDRRCVLAESFTFGNKGCSGSTLYWCHLIPKGRYGATRWIPENAITACAAHHKSFDENPLAKENWCADYLGSGAWEDLRETALLGSGMSVADVIVEYRALAAAATPSGEGESS
jgi:5-methylcytosine-specific restriction endonuclease McrA